MFLGQPVPTVAAPTVVIRPSRILIFPPTKFIDGSAIPAGYVAGAKIYWSNTSKVYSYTNSKDLGINYFSVTIGTTIPLTSGIWYFVVTVYDSAGNESIASNEVAGNLSPAMSYPSISIT